MAGSLNKVLLIGRLGADPEIKQTQGGKSFASLSLATSENWKDKNSGEKKEKTEWHRVVIFNEGLVNVVKQYLKKGAQIYVEGQLTTNKYTDNNGQEKYSTQIVLQGYNSTLKMLGGATGSPQGGVDQSSASSSLPSDDMSSPADLDDEVPF
jgi:single-strand DNA-binding protein